MIVLWLMLLTVAVGAMCYVGWKGIDSLHERHDEQMSEMNYLFTRAYAPELGKGSGPGVLPTNETTKTITTGVVIVQDKNEFGWPVKRLEDQRGRDISWCELSQFEQDLISEAFNVPEYIKQEL